MQRWKMLGHSQTYQTIRGKGATQLRSKRPTPMFPTSCYFLSLSDPFALTASLWHFNINSFQCSLAKTKLQQVPFDEFQRNIRGNLFPFAEPGAGIWENTKRHIMKTVMARIMKILSKWKGSVDRVLLAMIYTASSRGSHCTGFTMVKCVNASWRRRVV